jgi:hypothetical protein
MCALSSLIMSLVCFQLSQSASAKCRSRGPMQNVMNEAHIKLETPHEQGWVEHTFEDTFKHSLAIHCYHERHAGPGPEKQVVPVFEVWMCFDRQLQPFDCPGNVRRKCHGDVIFPSLDSGEQQLPCTACTHTLMHSLIHLYTSQGEHCSIAACSN